MAVVVCPNCGTKNRVEKDRMATQSARCGKCRTALVVSGPGAEFVSKPLIVTDATFERDVLGAGSTPVLVDAWAPWCGPCRMVAPIVDQIAAESKGRYRITKLNVDENPRIASQFRIQSIPTMLIFKEGKLVDRLVGAQPKQALEGRLRAA